MVHASEVHFLDFRVSLCFLLAVLVLPMSTFFHAVMASYGLWLAQIHPNAMLGW